MGFRVPLHNAARRPNLSPRSLSPGFPLYRTRPFKLLRILALRLVNMYLTTYGLGYILFSCRGKYFSTPNSSLNLIPTADTLYGSKHDNMKELRFKAADGVWRIAFAFDPEQKAILLVGGDKSGGSEKRFYRQLIKQADARFDRHLAFLKAEASKQKGAKQQ